MCSSYCTRTPPPPHYFELPRTEISVNGVNARLESLISSGFVFYFIFSFLPYAYNIIIVVQQLRVCEAFVAARKPMIMVTEQIYILARCITNQLTAQYSTETQRWIKHNNIIYVKSRCVDKRLRPRQSVSKNNIRPRHILKNLVRKLRET